MRLIKSAMIGVALLLSTAVTTPPAYASGFPVFDGSQFINQLQELLNWIDEMERLGYQLDELRDQTVTQLDQLGALTGEGVFGELLNGAAEFELRNHIPVTFNDLQGIEGNGTLAGTYAQEYRDIYQPVTPTELFGADGIDTPQAKRYAQEVDFTLSTLAASKSSYEVAGDRMAVIDAMLAEIDTTTDVKQSTDLQNRILLENMAIQNELLRVQSLRLQQEAQDKADRLAALRADSEFATGGLDGETAYEE